MSKALETKFDITEKPGPMIIVVETEGFTVKSAGSGWAAKKTVTYKDSTVDVVLVIRGQMGQEYEMTMELNTVKKDIKGELLQDGKNRLTYSYPVTDFNFQP